MGNKRYYAVCVSLALQAIFIVPAEIIGGIEVAFCDGVTVKGKSVGWMDGDNVCPTEHQADMRAHEMAERYGFHHIIRR